MNNNKQQHTQQVRTCEKCGKTRPGHFASFWYGKASRPHAIDVFTKVYTVKVNGSRSAWICERCTRRSMLFNLQPWLLVGIPLFVYFGLSIQYGHSALFGTVLGYSLILYTVLYIASQDSSYHLLEFWFGAGSRQAIKAHKKALKKQGHNVFWTPGCYEKMMKRKQ